MENAGKRNEGYGHVFKYTGIFGGVQGLNIVVGLVRNKFVAVLLGPSGMGLASLFNSVVSFVSQATSLGISFSAIRNLSEIVDSGDERRVERLVATVRAWTLVAALLGVLVCVAASDALSRYVFDGEGHALGIVALAPVVAMMAVTGGETALLKGARRLRDLAGIQVLTVFVSLVVSVPVYWLFGVGGIIPVIILMAAATMAFTLRSSLKLFPLRMSGAWSALGEGGAMVRLGLAFIVSGVFGSGAEMAVRSLLNNMADLGTVGLYNAGYMLTVTYASMVFSAMETDYFPRLSAVNHDRVAVNLAANRQIEVSLLIISPMLALLITALPLLVPLLYSGKFSAVAPMAQVATLSMYARAVMLPIAYITLAKGHSRAYIVIEGLSAVTMTCLVVVCFGRWGLVGAGVAVMLAQVADLLVMLIYAGVRYGYRPSRQVMACAALHVPLGLVAYAATHADALWVRLVVGLSAAALSTAMSGYVIFKKTSIREKLFGLFRRG